MKRIYIILFVIAILVAAILIIKKRKALETSLNQTSSNLNSYENRIDSIEKKVIDLTSPNDLLLVEEFNDLVNNSENYIDISIFFIRDTSNSIQQKMIVVFSLKNASFENYLSFFRESVDLFKKGEISENMIMLILNPGHNWNCEIVKNYGHNDVVILLNSLIEVKTLSKEMKYVIENTLNGMLWMTIKEEKEWDRKPND